MALLSKSIQDPVCVEDGIRVCIMRKPSVNTVWDIWMPVLAPSLNLLRSYNKGKIGWNEYVKQFYQEVIFDKQDHIRLLANMAQNNTITILCWEKLPNRCHRRLILEEVLRIRSSLKIIIK